MQGWNIIGREQVRRGLIWLLYLLSIFETMMIDVKTSLEQMQLYEDSSCLCMYYDLDPSSPSHYFSLKAGQHRTL